MGIWKELNKALEVNSSDRAIYSKNLDKLSPDNVYDDNIWGKNWGNFRRECEKEYKRRQTERINNQLEREARRNKLVEAASARFDEKERSEKEARLRTRTIFHWPERDEKGTQYHLSPDGIHRPCTAEPGNCKYKEEVVHFSAIQSDNPAILRSRGSLNMMAFHAATKAQESEDIIKREISIDVGEDIRSALYKNVTDPRKQTVVSEALLSVDLPDVGHLRLARKVGNTYENRVKDSGYWQILNSSGDVLLSSDTMNDDQIVDAVKKEIGHGKDFPVYAKEEVAAVTEELVGRIKDVVRAIEGEAAQANHLSPHRAQLEADFFHEIERQGDHIYGSVNYHSGFEPQHISALEASWKDLKSATTVNFGQGFSVVDTDMGDGSAQLGIKRGAEGWIATMRGSRNNIAHFTTLSSDDAESRVAQFIERNVKSKHSLAFGQEDKSKTVRSRSGFMGRLIKEEARRNEVRAAEKEWVEQNPNDISVLKNWYNTLDKARPYDAEKAAEDNK